MLITLDNVVESQFHLKLTLFVWFNLVNVNIGTLFLVQIQTQFKT